MRRPLLLALSLCLASSALADRVITVPMGRKIPFGEFKIDSFFELSNAKTWDRFVGIGVTKDFELDYYGERFANGPMRDTFNLSYNYLPPIMNESPGISVGVNDVLNRTAEGRRFYLAVTWRTAVDSIGSGNLPMDVTLGVSQGSTLLPFVGVSLPFGDPLRLLVEDDGFRIAAGVELKAFKNSFAARLLVRDQDVMLGANLTLRF
ncbi:MAG TPA: hypothetical protein VHE55_00130 [Fimbriimonadaceae bacterium]|nr:hypothetical protein [Fimbriimonadaceae bacterium]